MHVQVAVVALPDNVGLPPRQPAEPKKTQRAVRVVGLSRPNKVDSQMPPCSTKSGGLSKPGKCVAKAGNSTGAEAARKKSGGTGTASIENS